ncbi:hypothetical protein F5Y15DRAFT_180451 [Xylariaceae sp. FL0016]|nr:hypothetical protein F5Y15DRAFT_180451 [Xylariaceae sp. FL0016]
MSWYRNGGADDGFAWARNIYNRLTIGNVNACQWRVGTQDPATNNNTSEKFLLVDTDMCQVPRRIWVYA